MVTVEALKLLYTKLGGDADVSSVSSISDMVDLIEDVAGSGGGGGGGAYYCTADADNVLDKTYNEIAAMVEAGTAVYCKIELPSEGISQLVIASLNGFMEIENVFYGVLFAYIANDTSANVAAYVGETADGPLVLEVMPGG